MKFDIMVNSARMKSKEQCLKCTGAIKKNKHKSFKSYIRTVDEYEIVDIIKAGHTIIPAILDEQLPLCDGYFQYQQVFALDFDNKDPFTDGQKAVEAYFMSYERIMEISGRYGICPVVVYETFSSKPEWKKYRVLFVTTEPIVNREYRREFLTSLMKLFAINGIITADRKCIDESRIFYAGHTIVAVNQDVSVNSEMVINIANDIELQELVNQQYMKKKLAKKETVNNVMINAIINHDVITYKELLSDAIEKAKNIEVSRGNGKSKNPQTIIDKLLLKGYSLGKAQIDSAPTGSILYSDVFELTSRLPLNLLLGLPINKAFSCILPSHEDNIPSASINQHMDGRYIYNCWGCIDKNHYLDVIDIFSRLMDADIGKTVKFILTALELEVETEWQKNQRKTIEWNLKFINSDYFAEHYNVLYKELVKANALGQLKFFLDYAKDHMATESLTGDGRPTFFLSIRKASELMKAAGYIGTSIEAISRKLIYLCMLGLFDKVEEKDIPDNLLSRAMDVSRKNAEKNKRIHDYRQDFLYIPAYTSEMFQKAQDYIVWTRIQCVRRSSQCREQILRTYGLDAANCLYTQDTQRSLSVRSEKFYKKCREVSECQLSSNGITTEAEILKQLRGYSNIEKEKLSGRCLPQLLRDNGYQRVRVNKNNREKYNISDKYKSGSYVIVMGK